MLIDKEWLREAYETRDPEKIEIILEGLRFGGIVEVIRGPVFELPEKSEKPA